MPKPNSKTLADFKDEFKFREGVHLNNAGLAPLPRSAAELVTATVSDFQTKGALNDMQLIAGFVRVRAALAQFLSAEVEEVGFTQNCATALSQATLGFPLRPEDSVVTVDQEYSSNFYPYQVACERSGAKLIVVKSGANGELSTADLIAAIVPGVKIVGVSWVQFQTGSIIDLRAVGEHCRSVGAYFIVDGVQGIGQLPFSFKDLPVDFVAAASHKWMCGLTGQGFFAAKKEFLAKLSPTVVGGGTFNRFGTFADPELPMERSARKFEAGGFSFLGIYALEKCAEIIAATGTEVIAAEIARLSKIWRTGILTLSETVGRARLQLVTPLNQAGGITSFVMGVEEEVKFLQRCREEQIAVVKRGKFMRTSIHAFNSDDEIEKIFSVLNEIFHP